MKGVTHKEVGALVLGFDLAILLVGPDRFGLTWTGDLRYLSALIILLVVGLVLYTSETFEI
jgi:hypothetical protein